MKSFITISMASTIETATINHINSMAEQPWYVYMIVYGSDSTETRNLTDKVTDRVSYYAPMAVGSWVELVKKTGSIEAIEFTTSTGKSILFADSWYRFNGNNGEIIQREYDMNPSYRLDDQFSPVIEEALSCL